VRAKLEAAEGIDELTEFMDWSRCLMVGLQNQKVIGKIYESYIEAGKKRNECITAKIDKTLQKDETGILIMRESHQVQFPTDIQIIYVAPPALDEIKRWLREREEKGEK
jgi:guanylate kinase